ncbi:lipoprotein [Staphylococcus aureus M1224]|nr:lipoprotein [Staphylococcus aureus M1224]
MFKRTKLILIATILLSGCSTTNNESNNETKSVPEEMEASKYVGQGFQPPAEKDAIEFSKKHKDKIAKRGEQFFMDNFGLKVKATNVVGSGDGVEVFVHCDDHDIVFNASIPFDKSIIESDSSLRSEDKGDDMSTLVGTVLSGFENGRWAMFKRIKLILIATIILSGCSTTNNESNNETKSVPEEMEASKYVGQGFQPPAEKDAIEFAKKHRKEFEKVGEQFFKDNFGLKVKATNVVGKDDGVEVYVHCEDHGIVFNASLPLYKDAIHQKGSMRSNDNGDDMSMMVGTVLSGFEYRAQKEKYDNLYKFLKENEKKYQYTGFTKEAINKTQNVGYQNEYFYITYLSRNLKEYRKYYEPLIHKKDKEFKEGMQRARKELNYTANTDVVSTLFSTKKNFTKDNTVDDVIELSNKLKDKPNMPQKSQVTIQLGKPSINTKKPFYDDINPIEG